MAIGFRASSAAGATSGSSQTTSQAITIPAACAAGDVLVVCAVQVPISAVVATLSLASTGTAPVARGSQVTASESIATLAAGAWTVTCGAGDAGKVITASSTTTGFWSLAVAAYAGADNASPADVIGGTATAGGMAATVTCPPESTVTAGDWAVYLGGGAAEGGNLTVPSGSTSRESSATSGVNVFAVIADGNASAGASGTSIGGGTFTTGSATNSILAAFTLGLKPAGSSTSHPGAAALSGSGALTSAGLAVVPAAASLSGSGSLTTAASVSGQASATLSGSGSLAAGRALALKAAATLSGTGTLTSAGTVTPQFSAVFSSTDGNGVQTWTVTSALNGPSTSVLRILPPTSGSGSFPHSFLYALPVSTGTDATFGDPCTVIGQDLGAPNAYNATLVVPSFPIQPWYADNPLNAQQQQESFMLALAAWMSTSRFASGGEKNYLIGFSKSGIGGQGLQFRRPDVWAATASWDAPFMMTSFDGDDPTAGGTIGGDSADSYGTAGNFTANYALTSAHLTTWAAAGSLTTRRRLWVGGYFAFQADVSAYISLLTSAGIAFNGSHVSLDSSHAWHDGWVSDALASIMTDPGFLPAAVLSGSGSLTAGRTVTQPAAAALSGSGAMAPAGSATMPAGVALAGSGSLGAQPAVAFAPAAALSGSGALAAPRSVQFPAAAALTGTGALAAAEALALTAAAALSGSGALASAGLVTQPASASLSGAGALAASGAVQFTSAAVLAGSGALAAAMAVAQPAGASLSGSGSLTAARSVQFTLGAALSGLGALTAAGSVSGLAAGSAALSGSGALTVSAAVQLAAAGVLSGSGALLVAALVTAPASASLSGSGILLASAAVAVPASASLSGLGVIAASVTVSAPSGAVLSGSGALAAGAVITLSASASLAGLGVLAVSVQVVTPGAQAPVVWSAQPGPPRWRCSPAQPRWRVVMALFAPIAAVSLEEVNVTWMSSLAGTSVDPTGQTTGQPQLPVQMAFPATSGNYAEPAQPVTWLTASWLLGGTSIGYLSQCLVGPGGGAVTLASGQQYDVWAKIEGSPESPARFVGVQAVY